MIYIGTDIHGRGLCYVVAYENRKEFKRVARRWLERSDAFFEIKARSTIDDICHALRDHGPGFGSRSHRRIDRAEALKLL
jgi:hypothetical protein